MSYKNKNYYRQVWDGIKTLEDELPTASMSHDISLRNIDININNERIKQFKEIIQQIKEASQRGNFSIEFKNDYNLDNLIIKILRNKGYTYSLCIVGGKGYFHVIKWDQKIE